MLLVSVMTISCGVMNSGRPRYARVTRVPEPPVPALADDARAGKLDWPVSGRVVGSYGLRVDPTYGTKTKSLGIDIDCQRGAEVRAVHPGRVSFADLFMSYGKTVIVDHGDRLHSIYSGLADFQTVVGSHVRAGETIATALDTLHFEVRKGGQSDDPLRWLRRR